MTQWTFQFKKKNEPDLNYYGLYDSLFKTLKSVYFLQDSTIWTDEMKNRLSDVIENLAIKNGYKEWKWMRVETRLGLIDETKHRGTLVTESPEPEFYSERGMPLVTQSLYLLEYNEESKGMITVENYDKWYHMYIIRPDGKVEKVDWKDYVESRVGLTWIDHVISPECFHLTAKKLGLEYDDMTFAMVCERFVSDYLEDWTKIAFHLPVKDERYDLL
jgi:hypothetical protein